MGIMIEVVQEIRRLAGEGWNSTELAKKYKLPEQTIRMIVLQQMMSELESEQNA